MKHSSTKPLVTQTQNMFEDSAARRNPEQAEILNVAEQNHFPLQHCITPDGNELYAVRDWLAGVARTDNPVRFWNDLKKRLKKSNPQIYASCVQLPYLATDGKRYKMDYADGQTLYGITQHMGVDTGIRDTVLAYLAKTGAFIDAARRNPEQAELTINQYSRRKAEYEGKDETWILTREIGKVTRKQFVTLLLKVSPSANVGIATNIGYKGVLGTDAKGLNALLGQKTGDNPRDSMSRLSLAYTIVNEEAARLRLESFGEDEILPEMIVYRELKEVSETVGIQARDMAAQLGIDLISGKPALGDGK